jgi:hypothetical protein
MPRFLAESSTGHISSGFVLVEDAPDRRQKSRKLFRELGVLLRRICQRRQLFTKVRPAAQPAKCVRSIGNDRETVVASSSRS